jgi:SAM-dependent methyltransferase
VSPDRRSGIEDHGRTDRERRAYDEGGVWERCHAVHSRFRHVFRSPNSLRAERWIDDLLRERVPGRRVLELGCGRGDQAVKILSYGAEHVLALDVAEKFLGEARRKEVPGRLVFTNRDVTQPLPGVFDVIYGAAILHHIDYRAAVTRLYAENLNPGGVMLFREPLGENLLMRFWWWWGKAAHTPDERPFRRADLAWFAGRFPGLRVLPVNYLSFPAGVVSSLLFRRPDNLLTRFSDRVDRRIAERFPGLRHRFRHAVIVVEKSGLATPSPPPGI